MKYLYENSVKVAVFHSFVVCFRWFMRHCYVFIERNLKNYERSTFLKHHDEKDKQINMQIYKTDKQTLRKAGSQAGKQRQTDRAERLN